MQDSVAGEVFQLDNLVFLIVRNSGHLLPMDVPEAALDMITRFVEGSSFRDVPLQSDAYYAEITSDLPGVVTDDISKFKHDGKGNGKSSKSSSREPKKVAKLNTIAVLAIFLFVMAVSIVFFRSIFRDEQDSEIASLLPSHAPKNYQSSDVEINQKGQASVKG